MGKNALNKHFKGKSFSQADADAFIDAVSGKADLLNRIYAKLGLGAEYFKDRQPLKLAGFDFGEILGEKPYVKTFKKDSRAVSDLIHVTYILFGSRQMYIYRYAFNTDFTFKNEALVEVFYRDITAVTVRSDYVIVTDGDEGKDKSAFSVPNWYMSVSFGAECIEFPVPEDFDINNEELFNARKFIRDKKFLG